MQYRLITLTLMVLTLWACGPLRANAALDLQVTQGVKAALPIAVTSFKGEGDQHPLSSVIQSDLNASGRFSVWNKANAQSGAHKERINWRYWQQQKQNYLVTGEVTQSSQGQRHVHFKLWNVYDKNLMLESAFEGRPSQLRAMAHEMSDDIYHKLTGHKGVFATYIAYILVQYDASDDSDQAKPAHYKLVIADFDGHNPKTVFESDEPIMSPAWSPDGQQLAYVSFESHQPAIYTQNLATGKRQKVADFPGINGAPAWSPDGDQLAMVLSKSGRPDLFILDFEAFQLKRVTQDWAIDTEPEWSPDGRFVYFMSNRGGSPQIYRADLAHDNAIERMTFKGSYNASPALGPDGKRMAFLHRDHGHFTIAVKALDSDQVTQLTHGRNAQNPDMAPNGEMVIYGTQHGNQSVLGIASIDGDVHLRLPAQDGDVQEPAWSPMLTHNHEVQ